MRRENITREQAEKAARQRDRARESYFRTFYKVDPDNPLSYHLILNAATIGLETAAHLVIEAARTRTKG